MITRSANCLRCHRCYFCCLFPVSNDKSCLWMMVNVNLIYDPLLCFFRSLFWETISLCSSFGGGSMVKMCTLVQALRLCTSHTAYTGSRGIALPFVDHGTRSGWGVSVKPRTLFIPGKDPVSIVQEVERAPGPVWTGAENLAPTGFRSPNRPASSESLNRLSYLSHSFNGIRINMNLHSTKLYYVLLLP